MSPEPSPAVDRPVRIDFKNSGADGAIVFIHGFGGHAEQTWGDFPRYVERRPELEGWDVFGIGYSSSLRIELTRAWSGDASLETLGYYLRTALALPPLQRYKRLALVAHSMGGLVVQQALLDDACRARVSHVLLFGTPSAGVAKAGLIGRFNQQARDMVTGSEFLTKLRDSWPKAYADGEAFVLRVVAGERDSFIPTVSSLEPFPEAVRLVVPGDHLSMVKADGPNSAIVELLVQTLKDTARSASAASKSNLPQQLGRFIGREREIAEIETLLNASRLVTIAGTGGLGKTRTALEVAATFVGRVAGVWFVDFAPLTDPALVPSAIAAALGIDDTGHQELLDGIVLALKDSATLIIFDNCEHVLETAARVADRILRDCPRSRIIATTREALAIAGEHVYRFPTLSTNEGVALFEERAKSADSRFMLTEDNRPTIEAIVQQLDGIALAIELAAPRVKVLGVNQLAKRLDQRLTLLAGGSRTALPRQQTLRFLIGWSYDLLSEGERAFLRQLAVFRGTFSLEAVTDVCLRPDSVEDWDELLLLSSLIDKSLVIAEPGDDLRYRILESTREYALERLQEAGEYESTLSRHCRCFEGAAERAYSAVWTTNLADWLAQTRADIENYRAAIDWGLLQGHDPAAGAAIVANLLYLWDQSLTTEGRRLLERAKAVSEANSPGMLRAKILVADVTLADRDVGNPEACAPLAVAAASETGDRVTHAIALQMYGANLWRSGNGEEAVRQLERALEIARPLQFSHFTAMLLHSLGAACMSSGRNADGLRMSNEAASTFRELGDRRRLVSPLANIAEQNFASGDVDDAIAVASEAVAISAEMDAGLYETALVRTNLAAYLLRARHFAQAWASAREAILPALRSEAHIQLGVAIQHLANIAAVYGDAERAARLTGYVDALLIAAGIERRVAEASENIVYADLITLLRDKLSDNRLASLTKEGAAMTEQHAVEEAMAVPQPLLASEQVRS